MSDEFAAVKQEFALLKCEIVSVKQMRAANLALTMLALAELFSR